MGQCGRRRETLPEPHPLASMRGRRNGFGNMKAREPFTGSIEQEGPEPCLGNKVDLVLGNGSDEEKTVLPSIFVTIFGSQESCVQHHETGKTATLSPAAAHERAGPATNLGSVVELAPVTGVAAEAALRHKSGRTDRLADADISQPRSRALNWLTPSMKCWST